MPPPPNLAPKPMGVHTLLIGERMYNGTDLSQS